MSSKDYFETVAEDWQTLSSDFFGEAPRKAIYSKLNWNKIRTFADIGCGSGYLTEGALHRKVKAIAIDQSPQMLEVMQRKLGSETVDYRIGDYDNLPILSNSQDAVVANMYLHHVEDPKIALAEMYRILVPGGNLVFTDLDSHHHDWLVEEQHDRWMGFDRTELERWMLSAGFKDVVLDCVGSSCCAVSNTSGDRSEISIFIASGIK